MTATSPGSTNEKRSTDVPRTKSGKPGNEGDITPSVQPDKKPRRQRKSKVTKAMAEGLVQTVNLFLQMIPATSEDALNEIEVKAWTLSLVDLAERNQHAANLILKLVSVHSTGRIGLCVLGTVGPRLARRGVIPEMVGLAAGQLTYVAAGEGFTEPEEPVAFEPEPAFGVPLKVVE